MSSIMNLFQQSLCKTVSSDGEKESCILSEDTVLQKTVEINL